MNPAPNHKLLPLFSLTGTRHGSRSYRTCQFKCANACDHPEPNQTDNEHIRDIIQEALFSRRKVLKAGAAGVAAAGMSGLVASPAFAGPDRGDVTVPGYRSDLTFDPVPPNRRDNVVLPKGYRQSVVIAWGDPVEDGAPPFDVLNLTAEGQAKMFGYNCDYTMVLPLTDDKALLVCNHEYTDEYIMWPEGHYTEKEVAEITQAAHGMSVVAIERARKTGQWKVVGRGSRYNRRITAHTPMTVTGPAAGDSRVGTEALGTFNNCAGGVTPWGTVLSGEENFNGYFGVTQDPPPQEYHESFERYGIPTEAADGSWYNWYTQDPRFDLSQTPTEPFRHGWVVELDPYKPDQPPRKRTMLGRFKHEGATTSLTADGRLVAYSGDDERGDYQYKFVSTGMVNTEDRDANADLLDHGTLYVAKFTGDGTGDGEFDGTGEWIPLTSDTESFVDGMSVAEVLINTRLAADKVGATRMDRPEDVERNPVNGKVYTCLTNNSRRGTTWPADEANPITSSHVRDDFDGPLYETSGNRNGYILELSEDGNDGAATTFAWMLFLVCGDPEAPETYFGGFDKSQVSRISAPDNLTFDSRGNLWISTDGNALGANDGLFAVPVEGPERGNVQQFLTVPFAAETCGPLITEDDLSLFVAVQHPGETDDATFEDQDSTWPHTHDFPRPGIVSIWRKDRKYIGR